LSEVYVLLAFGRLTSSQSTGAEGFLHSNVGTVPLNVGFSLAATIVVGHPSTDLVIPVFGLDEAN